MKVCVAGFLTLICSVAWADHNLFVKNGLPTPEIVMAHETELGITSDQKQAIRMLFDSARQEAQALETDVRDQQQKLEALLKNSSIDSDETANQLKKLLDAESSLKLLQLKTMIKIRNILSPEQRKKLIDAVANNTVDRSNFDERFKDKAMKLKAAFSDLGIQPPQALQDKAKQLEELRRSLDYSSADKLVDEIMAEVGVNEPVDSTPIDFSKVEPGNTDIGELQDRLRNVEEQAKQVVWLPTLRKLFQARDELEKAKANQDANLAGRILTFAEQALAAKK